MKYLFTHIVGCLVLDNSLRIIEQINFSNIQEYLTKDKIENKTYNKYPDLRPLPNEKIVKVLDLLKDKKYFKEFYIKNLSLTEQLVKNSVSEDGLIIQVISNLEELDKVNNLLTRRLREWYSLYFPELSQKINSNEKYSNLVFSKTKTELVKSMNLKDTMGADLDQVHVGEMLLLAQQINSLYLLRKKHEHYLQIVMSSYCPNILELAGITIGAKLIELGKGLKNLALLPASTIQLLGAEKALFRHLKTGSKSPKHGIIINHSLIQNCKRENRGKAARVLADKLSLCARLDYFKGEFKAREYKKELENKF